MSCGDPSCTISRRASSNSAKRGDSKIISGALLAEVSIARRQISHGALASGGRREKKLVGRDSLIETELPCKSVRVIRL